jgi:predicted glycogen debranching enzyme
MRREGSMSDLTLERDRLGDLAVATGREWLVTNGIGGFATGTVSGALTRRYHGLLVAALDPPQRRTLLLAKLAERLGGDGDWTDLSTDLWASGAVEPRGHRHLLSFQLEDTIPVWTWAVAGTHLEKRVWMEHGENTTCIEYTLGADSRPTTLSLRAIVDHRDLHALTVRPACMPKVERTARGLCVRMVDTATPLWLAAAGAEVLPGGDWYRDFALPAERERGFEWVEDHFMAGELRVRLTPGERFLVVASTRPDAVAGPLAAVAARSRRIAHERILLEAWARARPAAARSAPAWVRRLVLAADSYVVARPSAARPDGRTVIAGYPWFLDWGRDTLVALPGLTLATGRAEVARAVLKTWVAHADGGLLPNQFGEAGGHPEYQAVDASLWLFQAVRALHEATGDDALLAELFPALEEIGARFERGGRHGIGVDPRDGLLRAGAEGLALTWMDARVDGVPVTPRHGKPVEVNALWYNALTAMVAFARRLGRPQDAYAQMVRRVGHAFERYWNAEAGCLYDVIDGPQGDDAAVRPNQLLAVSLPDTPLPAARRRAVLETCARVLLTPYGLRSLAPDDPCYRGRYAGSTPARDAAYHQGTAWVWLLPHYALAHYRVHGDRAAALALLEPLGALLDRLALGQLPELVEGEPPHEPRGAVAQAWSVGEALRVWHALSAAPERRPVGRGRRTLSAVGAE